MSSPARDHDLHERDLLAHLGIAGEQILERLQPQRYAFRVVQAIDADDQLAIGKQAVQFPGFLGYVRRFGAFPERLIVNADREMSKADFAFSDACDQDMSTSFDFEAVDQSSCTAHEITTVARRLETDQVEFEKRANQGLPPRQAEKKIRRRKRDVKEKSQARGDTHAA